MMNKKQNLKQIMVLRPDIKQTDLAKMLGCKDSFISLVKQGKERLPLRMAVKIAEIYGVPAEELHADVALVKQHLDGRES